MQDYNYRQVHAQIGSDLRLSGVGNNATLVADKLRTWGNVSGATSEREFSVQAGPYFVSLRAIDPATWGSGAYYEPDWFTGGSPGQLLQTLGASSNTVILDHGLASYYGISIGGSLTILNQTRQLASLRVVGFFGPDYSKVSPPGFVGGLGGFSALGWSYVSESFVTQYGSFFQTRNTTLVKASGSVSLSSLSSSIQVRYPGVTVQTAEVASQGLGSVLANGVLSVLRLGTVFAAASACIGLGAVSYTAFKEREKETTMIAVRGLSYSGLAGMLLTEVVPLVVFGLLLGSAVGLITVRGDAMASSFQSFSVNFYALLSPRRVVFPAWSQLQLGVIVGLLVAGVLVPTVLAARKNLSRMSRSVRFA